MNYNYPMRNFLRRMSAMILAMGLALASLPTQLLSQEIVLSEIRTAGPVAGSCTAAQFRQIVADQFNQFLAVPPANGIAQLKTIEESQSPVPPELSAAQASARTLLELISTPAIARIDFNDAPPFHEQLVQKLGAENIKTIVLTARHIHALAEGDPQLRRMLKQLRKRFVFNGTDDDLSAIAGRLHGFFETSNILTDAVAGPVVVPAARTDRWLSLYGQGKLINGKRFADNVVSVIEKNNTPFHVKINRKKNFILALFMWAGASYALHSDGPVKDNDIEVYWATGKNPIDWQLGDKSKDLYDWLLAQSDHSVGPEDLFLKSMEIADGSIWEALNMGWTVLAIGRTIGGRERNYLQKTQKLVDIRGDQKLLPLIHDLKDHNYRWTSKADNFSAWYHFWGTMLYSFFRDSTFVLLPLPGKWIVGGMILLEELFYGPFEWVRRGEWRAFLDMSTRIRIDIQGAVAGSRLASNLKALRKKP